MRNIISKTEQAGLPKESLPIAGGRNSMMFKVPSPKLFFDSEQCTVLVRSCCLISFVKEIIIVKYFAFWYRQLLGESVAVHTNLMIRPIVKEKLFLLN